MSELMHYPSGYSSIFGNLEPQKKIVAPIVLPYFLVFFNVTFIYFFFSKKSIGSRIYRIMEKECMNYQEMPTSLLTMLIVLLKFYVFFSCTKYE